MIQIKNVKKEFFQGQERTEVLRGVDLTVEEGEFVAVMGPSGSGKSTLLQLLGGLDLPTDGEILIDEHQLSEMNEKERTIFRRKQIGFVFQNYQSRLR